MLKQLSFTKDDVKQQAKESKFPVHTVIVEQFSENLHPGVFEKHSFSRLKNLFVITHVREEKASVSNSDFCSEVTSIVLGVTLFL